MVPQSLTFHAVQVSGCQHLGLSLIRGDTLVRCALQRGHAADAHSLLQVVGNSLPTRHLAPGLALLPPSGQAFPRPREAAGTKETDGSKQGEWRQALPLAGDKDLMVLTEFPSLQVSMS